MIKRFCTLTFFFCITVATFSQRTIKGRVVTAADIAVPGSSVFISNTSKGTTTDREGNFELNDVPAGKHELVISSIGYETNVYSFSAEQLPLRLKVVMELKVKELQNVLVEASVEEGWDKWGKLFTDNFIGSTPNGESCKIKNEKAIRFRHYKKSGRLIAYSDEPIILENKALGYSIRYQMENFEVNFKEHSSAFSGYPFFEDMDKKRKGLQNKWKQKRDKAYYGSMTHFMRSVYKNNLEAEGFEVRRMVKELNAEKERVKKISVPLRGAVRSNITGVTIRNSSGVVVSPETIIGRKDSLSTDSASYYRRIMQQDDYKEIYGKDILTADSITIDADDQYKALFFTDFLYVTYKKEYEDIEYIRFSHESRSVTFQRSYLRLTNPEGVVIDENGSYFPPQAIYSMAYWGWSEKMSDLLPIDYEPNNKRN